MILLFASAWISNLLSLVLYNIDLQQLPPHVQSVVQIER